MPDPYYVALGYIVAGRGSIKALEAAGLDAKQFMAHVLANEDTAKELLRAVMGRDSLVEPEEEE